MSKFALGIIDAALILIAVILIGVEYGWMTGIATGLIAHAVRSIN